MNELKALINRCEAAGIADAENIISRALVEQHRNTRHDAIDTLLKKGAKADNPLFAFIVVDVQNDIMNLKQRSPL